MAFGLSAIGLLKPSGIETNEIDGRTDASRKRPSVSDKMPAMCGRLVSVGGC